MYRVVFYVNWTHLVIHCTIFAAFLFQSCSIVEYMTKNEATLTFALKLTQVFFFFVTAKLLPTATAEYMREKSATIMRGEQGTKVRTTKRD